MSFDYTMTSNKTIDEVTSDLEEALKDEGFGVLWQFDVKEKLQSKGLDYQEEFRVLEVCNPFEAERVLKVNKMIGYFLPCKMVVYEEGGEIKVGLPKPSAMVGMLGSSELISIASDIEKRLISCIQKSVG